MLTQSPVDLIFIHIFTLAHSLGVAYGFNIALSIEKSSPTHVICDFNLVSRITRWLTIICGSLFQVAHK